MHLHLTDSVAGNPPMLTLRCGACLLKLADRSRKAALTKDIALEILQTHALGVADILTLATTIWIRREGHAPFTLHKHETLGFTCFGQIGLHGI